MTINSKDHDQKRTTIKKAMVKGPSRSKDGHELNNK
jgi:hypothetical protein